MAGYRLLVVIGTLAVVSTLSAGPVGAVPAPDAGPPSGHPSVPTSEDPGVRLPAFESPEQVCLSASTATGTKTAHLLLPDGRVISGNGTVRLYPGSDVRIVVCRPQKDAPSPRAAWELTRTAGLDDIGPVGSQYIRRATISAPNGRLRLGDAIGPGGIVAPTVVVPRGPVHESRVASRTPRSPVDGEIRFQSISALETFRTNESEYIAAHAALLETLERINRTDDTVAVVGPEAGAGTLSELQRRVKALRRARASVRETLFTAAFNGSDAAVPVVRAYDRNLTRTERRVQWTVEAVERDVERDSPSPSGLWVQFLGPLLVGLLIGGGGGWYYTDRELEDAIRRRQYSSSVSLGLDRLRVPMAVALVLLLLGVGLLIGTGLLGTLLGGVLQ
jgi:hypothetical protein